MSADEPMICRNCHGAGKAEEPCGDCGGKGWLQPEDFEGAYNCRCSNFRCSACGGTGRTIVPAVAQ